jgi:hypothetical protein
MADHFDAPGFTSPDGDSRIDITDHYVFPSPAGQGRVVFVLDVNPFASADNFRPDAEYQTMVDTDGDLAPDVTFRYTFTPKDPNSGAQFATVTRTDDHGTQILIPAAPVSFGSSPVITEGASGTQFFAGLRSEPFFFDTEAFINNMSFHNPGTDFFAGRNVYGIVLEVPESLVGAEGQAIGVETLTRIPSTYDPAQLMPADQMGRALVNTFYNSGNDENTFNQTPPAGQRQARTQSGQTFVQSFTDTLEKWGYTLAQAKQIALWLLPDILSFDNSRPSGYPNGRQLRDDVVDYMLNQLTNGQKPSDYVGPHTDYLSVFPYLGTPH